MLLHKCASCGRDVKPSLPYSGDYICYKKKWYHINCLKQYFPKLNVGAYAKKTAIIVENEVNKDNLIEYLKRTYSIHFMPGTMQQNFDNIASGKYKDFDIALPLDQLLEMFKHYAVYLDAQADWRKRNVSSKVAESSSGTSRLFYDLSIVLSKYDEYLKETHLNQIEDRVEIAHAPTVQDMKPYYADKEARDKKDGRLDVYSLFDAMQEEYDNEL